MQGVVYEDNTITKLKDIKPGDTIAFLSRDSDDVYQIVMIISIQIIDDILNCTMLRPFGYGHDMLDKFRWDMIMFDWTLDRLQMKRVKITR